jgi:hypothetical protein
MRLRDFLCAMVFAGLLGGAAFEAAAQPAVTWLSKDPARQREFRRSTYKELNESFNLAIDYQKKGECYWFVALINSVESYSIYDNIRSKAAQQGIELAPEHLQHIVARASDLARKLWSRNCPPTQLTAADAARWGINPGSGQIRPVEVQVGAGAWTLFGVDVGNGNLGGEQDIISGNIDLTLGRPFGRHFPADEPFRRDSYSFLEGGALDSIRFFIGHGKSDKNVSGPGNVLLQPNGGIQDTTGAGAVSGGTREADVFRVGGDLQYNLPHFQNGALPFVPFIGGGFEHFRLETRLFANWAPISFSVEDIRKVTTNRAYVFVGGQQNFVWQPNFIAYVRGQLQLNGDFVNGTGTYHTAQAVPGGFDETVTGSASKTALTFAGQFGGGAVVRLANGARIELNALTHYMPIWEALYHNGRPMTVEDNYKWGWAVNGRVGIPLDAAPLQRLATQ